MHPSFRFLLCLSVSGALLTGCTGGQEDLPQGIQTLEGLLKPAELSRVRRGTHIMEIDGEDAYYAESSVVPLRNYQNKVVTLRGTFTQNVDSSYMPVFVVDSILDVQETSAEHVLEEFAVRLVAPVLWKPKKVGETVEFTAGDMGPVLLTLSQRKADELPEEGEQLVVGGKRSVRVVDPLTENSRISVQQNSTTVFEITFSAGSEEMDSALLIEQQDAVLGSIIFREKATTTTPRSGTGGAVGSPCGGSAGVLCPAGMYCEVTNFAENIGRCRAM